MNQNSIELLSSEELEIVTGGTWTEEVTKFGKGLAGPVRDFLSKNSWGTFDTNELSESIGRATSSGILIAATVYSTYQLIRSKLGKKAEDVKSAN